MKQGKIFVISGPSGVGKGTIVAQLIKKSKLNFYWAKSYTTRKERKSDESERHYIFVDDNKFKDLKKKGEIIESNFYNGYWYGSSRSEINNALKTGKNVLKEVEVNGGLAYKKLYPDVILIFIKAGMDDIKNRLISRGQNTKQEIEKRLKIAKKELALEREYHHSIINPEGHPEKAVEEVEKMIRQHTA